MTALAGVLLVADEVTGAEWRIEYPLQAGKDWVQ
jgi:hypothetical protein